MHTFLSYNRIKSTCIAVFLFCFVDVTAGWGQNLTVEELEYTAAHTAYIDGLAAFENNDFENAINLLNKAYVKLPEHPGVNFALADAYFEIGDFENAAYYSKQARELDPQNKWYHLLLVDIYLAEGKTETAITALNNALSYHPRDNDILYKLAESYTNKGDFNRANAIYNRLLKLQGELVSLRLNKLQNFNKLNQKDSAVVELEKIRSLEPGNLATLRLLAKYYLDLSKPDEAHEVIQHALTINSRDTKSILTLADIQLKQARWDSAQKTLTTLLEDSLATASAKTEAIQFIYTQFNNAPQNKAIEKITGAIFDLLENHPVASGEAYLWAADFYTTTNQQEKALNALRFATDRNPADDSAWQQRLQLLLKKREFNELIRVGKQAITHVPQDPILLYFLGNAYLSTQQYEEAIDHLKEASSLPARRPLKANILGSLADTYAATERWSQAFDNYQKAIDLKTKNPVIFNNYAYYLSRQETDLPKAKKLGLRALEMDPDNTSFLDTVGWIYYQQNLFQEAKKYIQQAVTGGDANAEILEHMGDVLLKLDKPKEAKSWWKKAFEKDSTRTYLQEKIAN